MKLEVLPLSLSVLDIMLTAMYAHYETCVIALECYKKFKDVMRLNLHLVSDCNLLKQPVGIYIVAILDKSLSRKYHFKQDLLFRGVYSA